MPEQTNTLAIEERQAREKEAVINALKEMPIAQLACKKAGVSRATYYRWRQEDKLFKRQSVDAMQYGVEFINDMSESQLVTLIKEKKMPAIAMWLKHRHTSYGAKTTQHTPLATQEELTQEEMDVFTKALAMATGTRTTHAKSRPTIHREHTR